MIVFEQAEPGDTQPPTAEPHRPEIRLMPDGWTDLGADPRTTYATMILSASLGGFGLMGLANTIRPKPDGTPPAVVRDAVRAAFAVADELLKQAWDEPPAAV